MSLPKEPRQLMINLMYLVLTALLAMNVSSEILNAFKIIGKSIVRSNNAAEVRNTAVSADFQEYIDNPKTQEEKRKKVSDALLLANQVNDKTKSLITILQGYKDQIVQAAGGLDKNGEIRRIDDLDAGTKVMIEEKNGPKMLQELKTFKDEIAGLVPSNDSIMVGAGIGNNKVIYDQLPLTFDMEKTDLNPDGDWSFGNFHMSPSIANVTLIDKYISDVRSCQTIALDNIWSLATGEHHKEVHTTPRPFNDYIIMVSADNSFVLPGEKYHARVVMGAYNKKLNNLSFVVNGKTITPVDGVADFTDIAPTTPGPRNVTVTASFNDTIPGTKTVQRRTIQLEKPAQYFVGEAQASIALDKMNVLYVGLDNPITFAVSGIPGGNVSYTSDNCNLTKATGVNKYTVAVTKPGGTASISLKGKRADGIEQTFGPFTYRIKRVPPPYPSIAGKSGGAIGANELKVQEAVFAKLIDFVYELDFPVVSFTMTLQPKRGEAEEASSNTMYLTGPKANPSIAALMAKIKINDRVYFENIRAKAPDGIRNIGSVNFIINN